ncbi:MAG: ribonuclease E/G, partial [Candidatus Omnitrophota bacterium]
MLKEILINVEPQEKRVAITCDGRLEEFYIERPEDKTIVGNIYKGQISSIASSMNAAFVDIGLSKNGFIYLSEAIETLEPADLYNLEKKINLKVGQEILVQVIKEPYGTKGPKLTSHISLPGRYLVLMPFDSQRGISRRIEDEKERKRLQGILEEMNLPKDMGFIVRTEANNKDKHELLRDAKFLIKLWYRIKKMSAHKKPPNFIYQEYDLILRIVRDSFTKDITRLVVDSKDEYKRVWRFVRNFSKELL